MKILRCWSARGSSARAAPLHSPRSRALSRGAASRQIGLQLGRWPKRTCQKRPLRRAAVEVSRELLGSWPCWWEPARPSHPQPSHASAAGVTFASRRMHDQPDLQSAAHVAGPTLSVPSGHWSSDEVCLRSTLCDASANNCKHPSPLPAPHIRTATLSPKPFTPFLIAPYYAIPSPLSDIVHESFALV